MVLVVTEERPSAMGPAENSLTVSCTSLVQKNGVGLLRNADVGILVEHLVDKDEVLIILIVTARMSKVRPMWWVAVETMYTYDPEPCLRDGQGSP